MPIFVFVLMLLHLGGAVTAAQAAQDATVIVEQAAIRERPTLDALVMESPEAGTVLRISNTSKDGWFKTRTSTGRIGWVWQADIRLEKYGEHFQGGNLSPEDRTRSTRHEAKGESFYVKLGGLMFVMWAPQFGENLGLDEKSIFLNSGFFGELSYRLNDDLCISLRHMQYSNEYSIVHGGLEYETAQSGKSLLLGLEKDLSVGAIFSSTVGLYLGAAINTVKVTTVSAPPPNSFIIESPYPAAFFNWSTRYSLSKLFSIIGQAGIYLTQIPSTRIPNSFNGDEPFRAGERMQRVRIGHVGPMISLGLQLSL